MGTNSEARKRAEERVALLESTLRTVRGEVVVLTTELDPGTPLKQFGDKTVQTITEVLAGSPEED